jgi:hypothetical protein
LRTLDVWRNWSTVLKFSIWKILKVIFRQALSVTGISFLLFWIIWGLLMAALPPIGLWQFLGFAPTPPPSFWQSLLMLLFEVLSLPASIMMSVVNHDTGKCGFALFSLANSVVWGLCLGFPIYAAQRRFFTHAV